LTGIQKEFMFVPSASKKVILRKPD